MLTELKGLYDYLQRNRNSGTTTLIQKVAQENVVVVVIAATMEQGKRMFGDKAIVINSTRMGGMGRQRKPILIDNFTLLELCRSSISDLERVEVKNKGLETKIEQQE